MYLFTYILHINIHFAYILSSTHPSVSVIVFSLYTPWQQDISSKFCSNNKSIFSYRLMGNVISLKWQTYHRHMVNTGDWQLFSILHGRQDGLWHVWGQPVAFKGLKTKWNWSEIDEFLSILPNRIEWEKSIYNIISLCTTVNFVCHVHYQN